MDQFTLTRLTRLLETWKARHGRDISATELEGQGFSQEQIKHATAKGLIQKYQATNAGGSKENRFKLARDWRSLRE